MDQYIGKLLDNRYEILEVVGTGGMARVYKARCHRLNRLVAVKILRDDLSREADLRRRFHDESQAVAMLSHPNIVAVYDVSRSSEVEYIVMELIEGISLKQYMQKKGNKLNWREALHFITQITKALGHAHSRGIIHRDIKPHNVMVLRDGSVKVADFGIARVASGGHSTLTQEALGSVHYISPEQARGSYIDARSDLYSTGVVLYEMITGRLPFEGDSPVSVAIQHINSIPLTPREIDPTIPEALEAITMKAMAPNPSNRYSSADEMLADLEEFRKNPNINFDYNIAEFSPEEEPDDRTQIRSVTPHSRESRERDRHSGHHSSERRSRPRYEEEEDERRGSVLPAFVAVLAILMFVGGVLFFLYRTVFSGFFTPAETYPVPNLLGKQYEAVLSNKDLLGRFTLVLDRTVTNDAEPGTILSQDPTAGTSVNATITDITVTVSGGPELCYVPDIYDMDYLEAFLAIREAGLAVGKPTYEHHEEIEVNHVISFTPLKEVPLAPGTEVQIVVSLGPEIKEFEMFSLVGMLQSNAESQIVLNNLVVGTVTPVFHDTVEAGIIVDQYPTFGTSVKEGDTINLMVSQGPDPSTITPNDVTITMDITLPPTGDIVSLVVMMDGEVIWESEHDTAMEAFVSLPISAPVGTSKTVTYFIDGVMSGSKTLHFGA